MDNLNVNIEEIEEEDDFEFEQEHPSEASSFIPSFEMMMHGVSNLILSVPKMHSIDGFKFLLGTPISPNFLVQHEFSLKKKSKNPQMMMMMPGAEDHFYTMQTHYQHGNLTGPKPKINFNLVGMFNSGGDVHAIFSKQWSRFTFKLHSQFYKGPQQSVTQCQLVHKGKEMVQSLMYSS